MSGIFFNYFDGYLRVVFHPVQHGAVPFDLVLHGDVAARTPCDDQLTLGEPVIDARGDVTVRMWIGAALGGFRALIAWLEAITCGVQECACAWDAEGPDCELRWNGPWNSGVLNVVWTRGDQKHTVRLNKAQMVRAFYESFRDFVASGHYDPLAFEELNAGEIFALVLEGDGLDALADHLAALPHGAAEACMLTMLDTAWDTDAGYPRRASLATFMGRSAHRQVDDWEEQWVPLEWESWDFAERRHAVVQRIYTHAAIIECGEKLRDLRSPLIEHWLAAQPENEPLTERAKP